MKPFSIPTITPNPQSANFRCGFLQEYLQSDDEYARYFVAQLTSIHRLDFFVWIICTKGQMVQMLDCEQVMLKAGQAVLIRPNQVHQVLDFDNGDGFFVAWRDEFLLKTVALKTVPSVQIFNKQDAEILISFGKLLQSGDDIWDLTFKTPFLQNQLTAFLYYLTHKFYQNKGLASKTEKRYWAFIELLETHFYTQKQVQFYAHRLHCSPKTLNIACQNETGECVKSLIEKRILLESKRLLVHSNLSINAIADELGFIDGTQFAKFFKKYEHITANEFREKFQIK